MQIFTCCLQHRLRDKDGSFTASDAESFDESELTDDVFDYILIDCPAGIEQGFQNAIAGATRALIVTTPEISALRDADRVKRTA